ncbi:HIT-like protein [Testicularia cyperi]|uniref:HIT-like protein n=1 Tax=Testicularia cyperi TaxID=1882483 RepID=A0A317Y2H1_9BASI|nr:HIT-like protein [Testicularia cyperi]
MSSLFGGCFGRSSHKASSGQLDSEDPELLGPTGSRPIDAVNPAKCVFCNVDSSRFRVVLEDSDYICFSDRSPAAAIHLLVIPRRHIANVQSLTRSDAEIVRQMQVLGNAALDIVSGQEPTPQQSDTSIKTTPERRFGFHIPPFRSVDHLHLHCLQLPFRSTLRSLKYRVADPPSREYHKGWSWFAEWKQTCAILQDGGRVKVGKC